MFRSSRRTFLKQSALSAAAAALPSTALAAFGDSSVGAAAVRARAPLTAGAFTLLPLGSVKPAGWLKAQLLIQANGLSGHLDETWADVGPNSGWPGGTGESWERGPYFLDGLIPLAWLLDDERLKAKAHKYVEWTLQHQQANGMIGPASNDDWWPRIVMLKALTQFYEVSGDARVLPLMDRYFRHQLAALPGRPLRDWGKFRWQDEALSVIWLYNRTGEPYLVELAKLLHQQGHDWIAQYADFQYKQKITAEFIKLNEGGGLKDLALATHGVNNGQALKTGAVWSLVSGSASDRAAVLQMLGELDKYHGLPNGMFSCDEHLSGRDPSQGSELCTVVEAMFSLEQALAVTGEAALGDRLEKLAFNALPGTFTDDMWAHQYNQEPNQVECSLHHKPWVSDGPESNLYGLEPNFGCCTANFHQGWPKFAASLFMLSGANQSDDGLVAAAYAPCEVRTRIRGVAVHVMEQTEYPFRGAVRLTVNRALVFGGIFMLATTAWAQSPAPSGQQQPHASQPMTSTPPQTGQFDAQHRPITAGGFVKTGPIIFQNFAAQAGLTAWRNVTGGPDKKLIIEAKGSGVCLIDFDRDGWLDIYLVNGSTLAAHEGKASAPHAALFRNNHDGTFTDVTQKAGVTNERWGLGCAVGDYDNDSWPDLYVTNLGTNRLYHNKHDGTFEDVAEKAGVALKGDNPDVVADHTGATFGDYDGDGRLDLFVAGYVMYDFKNPPVVGSKSVKNPTCQYRAVEVMCGPRGLEGAEDHLFHNNGDGTFTDVTTKTGVGDKSRFYGLGAVFADVNNDGKVDLAVANDSTPNYLYINKGDGTFEDASYTSGFAVNEAGREVANMGLAVGDFENNGHLDIVSTTFSDDYFVVYRNDGAGTFEDVSYGVGVAQPTIPFVGFGDGFLDYDNDGFKDLLFINGHVYPGVDKEPGWGMSYAQRPLLFHNDGKGKFEVVPAVEGTGLAETAIGRGAAFGDLFNDGKIDVVINALDAPPLLLRNVNMDRHHWIDVQLVGGAKSPRDAIGATVYLTVNNMRQRADVLSGGSYLSSNDLRLHFGLGESTKIDSLEIHWPSGAVETFKIPAVDRILTIEESKGITSEWCRTCPTK